MRPRDVKGRSKGRHRGVRDRYECVTGSKVSSSGAGSLLLRSKEDVICGGASRVSKWMSLKKELVICRLQPQEAK